MFSYEKFSHTKKENGIMSPQVLITVYQKVFTIWKFISSIQLHPMHTQIYMHIYNILKYN